MKLRDGMKVETLEHQFYCAGNVKAGTVCRIKKVRISEDNKNDCLVCRQGDACFDAYILDIPRKNKRYVHMVTNESFSWLKAV